MEAEARHARVRAQRSRRARGSAMGTWGTIKWLIIRTIALILGTFGWIISVTGALYVGLGVLCVKWSRRFKDAADASRFEA